MLAGNDSKLNNSKLYRDFDKNGRALSVMSQKAKQAGATNLKTTQYRHDSPISRDQFKHKSHARDEKGHSKDVLETSKAVAMFGSLTNRTNIVDNVLPQKEESMRFIDGMFRSTETEEKIRDRFQFMEKTTAENQFILEASFCAVSDLLMESLGNDLEAWMRLSLVDKVLQFTSLLQHMRKDIRLGGLVGVF